MKTSNNTIVLKFRRGIDDLSDRLGERTADWWNSEDWAKWEAGKKDRQEKDKNYIEQLKAEGRYEEEFEISCTIPECDWMDTSSKVNTPLESYRMFIIPSTDEK